MRLVDLCEPLFQYVCYVNRLARKGGSMPPKELEARLESLLAEIEMKAKADPRFALAYDDKVRWALMFFADSMVRQSRLPYAATWSGLAPKRGNKAGDEQFFDKLDQTLEEDGEVARERLAVFYTCLGLGFTGMYAVEPDAVEKVIRPKMREVFARIGGRVDEQPGRMCPEAYENIDTSELTRSSSKALVMAGSVAAVCLVGALVANYILFKRAESQLGSALRRIDIAHAAIVAPTAALAPPAPVATPAGAGKP